MAGNIIGKHLFLLFLNIHNFSGCQGATPYIYSIFTGMPGSYLKPTYKRNLL
jgi:hypothetical protein